MNNALPLGRIRLLLFIAVTILHVFAILLIVVNMDSSVSPPAPEAGVMRLVDVEEEQPAEPEPPPVIQEAIAEHMVETDEEPPPAVIGALLPPPAAGSEEDGSDRIIYLPQSQITVLPVLPEDQIRRAMIYPPIAQRSNIEGVVYLELFIDRQGNVRDVRILRENPPNRGFGDAAVNAFRGIRGRPAEANGEPVAVRYRYNINFKLD